MIKRILSASPMAQLSAFALVAVAMLLPMVASASIASSQLGTFVKEVIDFINSILVPLVFAIAFLVFIWGVFEYFILGGADEEKRAQGRSLMLYAIIGFVLMVSIWGIVNVVADGLGFRTEQIQQIPDVPNSNT